MPHHKSETQVALRGCPLMAWDGLLGHHFLHSSEHSAFTEEAFHIFLTGNIHIQNRNTQFKE